MKITPLASDSLGTRSMATCVETGDVRILIDPGVSLGPSRYGLPPHPIEFQRMNKHWGSIKKFAKKADVLIVTHYHYDHHDPTEPELYRDKVALLKHPTEKINRSQKERAKFFLEQLEGMPERIEYCDGREFSFGGTKIKFSQPVFHGTDNKLGYVVEISISDENFKFVFTSDVEGPSVRDQVSFILEEKPNIIYADGPLSYMLGYRYSQASLNASVNNIIEIFRETPVEKFVIDHHFLRDIKWKERIKPAFDAAENVQILTAAEFSGQRNDLLEA
ncbi:MAG: MBL fold metallo-hydrolase, partial [Candidatus Hydrothermarchaeota archaeon]|nr:MBL fold metallo-hydrolase [Candidatus Hydrothermarchaeota archaeon]